MTFNEALKKLTELYPNDYVALKYERSIHGQEHKHKESNNSPEITCYTSSTGWTKPQKNFNDAINATYASKDLDPGIDDEGDDSATNNTCLP